METKGLRIAFLGYCDDFLIHGKRNCTEMRSLFSTGPAIYQDAIATRDVKNLKAVNYIQSCVKVIHGNDF